MPGLTQTGDMAAAAKRFFRLGAGVEIAAFTVTRTQALDALYMLAKDTPVDVGTARSNWRISVGRPLTGKVKAHFPYPSRHRKPYGPGGKKSEGANLSAVMAAGNTRLGTYKGKLTGFTAKGSIYISNTLPYIGPLDRGHSRQTTSGFVARAILAATSRTRPKIKPIFDKEFSK